MLCYAILCYRPLWSSDFGLRFVQNPECSIVSNVKVTCTRSFPLHYLCVNRDNSTAIFSQFLDCDDVVTANFAIVGKQCYIPPWWCRTQKSESFVTCVFPFVTAQLPTSQLASCTTTSLIMNRA